MTLTSVPPPGEAPRRTTSTPTPPRRYFGAFIAVSVTAVCLLIGLIFAIMAEHGKDTRSFEQVFNDERNPFNRDYPPDAFYPVEYDAHFELPFNDGRVSAYWFNMPACTQGSLDRMPTEARDWEGFWQWAQRHPGITVAPLVQNIDAKDIDKTKTDTVYFGDFDHTALIIKVRFDERVTPAEAADHAAMTMRDMVPLVPCG